MSVRAGGSAPPTDSLGLESGTVVLREADVRWPRLFEEAAAELREALGARILGVHHVGSTSIPGLCAKPVLDLMVSVPDLAGGLELVPGLEALGYEFRPKENIPDRHFFRRSNGILRTHHLSMAEPDSRFHRVTLAFRDALRADPGLAARYAALKRDLAERYPLDREAYLEGKSEFVAEVLRRAREGR